MPARFFLIVIVLLAAVAASAVAAGPQRRAERNFDEDAPDAAPAGFKFASMRQEDPGVWLIRREGANGFLAHPAAEGARGFSMAIADGLPIGDVAASVRVRLSGRGSAGLISRYQDARNYYMTLLDIEDGEMRMYRVFEGNRNRIEFRDDLELDPNAWHTLKVVHLERSVYAMVGGIRVFEDRQPVNHAFPAGQCGLIAIGDTEAWFDDLTVEPVRSGHVGSR